MCGIKETQAIYITVAFLAEINRVLVLTVVDHLKPKEYNKFMKGQRRSKRC